jgi:hypothetical protein
VAWEGLRGRALSMPGVVCRRRDLLGLILVKELALIDLEARTRIGECRMRPLPMLRADTAMCAHTPPMCLHTLPACLHALACLVAQLALLLLWRSLGSYDQAMGHPCRAFGSACSALTHYASHII